ncbi:MAG: hypothetical protein KF819_23215 [Labilithrix sp.]|nr:hypothetical protein [Labilithrix sp.]
MTPRRAIRNAEGKYLNASMAMGQPRWGAPQWATCVPADQAETLAQAMGGEVVDVPTWDETKKEWRK